MPSSSSLSPVSETTGSAAESMKDKKRQQRTALASIVGGLRANPNTLAKWHGTARGVLHARLPPALRSSLERRARRLDRVGLLVALEIIGEDRIPLGDMLLRACERDVSERRSKKSGLTGRTIKELGLDRWAGELRAALKAAFLCHFRRISFALAHNDTLGVFPLRLSKKGDGRTTRALARADRIDLGARFAG